MDQKAVGKNRCNGRKKVNNIIMKNDQNDCGKSGTESEDDDNQNQIHIWTERERRKKMRNMFSSLRDLLPPHKLPIKGDKSSIVDEAVKYIKTLEQTLQTLQKQRVKKLQINATPTNIIHHDQVSSTRNLHPNHHNQARDQLRELFLADNQEANSKNNILMPREKNRATNFQTWFSPNVVVNMCGDDAQISICSPRKPGLLATIFYILDKHNLDVISSHISSDLCRSFYMIHAHASGASEDSGQDVFKLAAGEMNLWILSCQ